MSFFYFSVTHLADKMMEMSVPSIFSACWTFCIMGLLTWAINHKNQTDKNIRIKDQKALLDDGNMFWLIIFKSTILQHYG